MGQPYTLVDDDDFDLNDQSPEFLDGDNGETVLEFPAATALLQNAFEPAFILPIRDGSQENFNIPFNLNIEANDEQAQINTWRGLTGSDDFWTSYIQIGYQGGLTEPNRTGDGDPDSELAVGGVTLGSCNQGQSDSCSYTMNPGGITSASEVPKGGVGSLVYVEGEKEGLRGVPNVRELTIPHEIGHQFGLTHDMEGLMDIGGGSNSFSQNHLNLLRWRSTSPGQ